MQESGERHIGRLSGEVANRAPTVFMMDLLATVPYYTAYLSQALLTDGVKVLIGSIPYYLDTQCFCSRSLRLMPGLLRIAAIPVLPRVMRRGIKIFEAVINLLTLSVRFAWKPPDIVHVQYLPLLLYGLPLESMLLQVCRLRGSKLVFTVHDLLPHDTGDRHRRTFEKIYRSMDALICHSDGVRRQLVAEYGIPKTKVATIEHGPFFYDMASCGDSAGPDADHSEEVIVLWQGILLPYKGVDVLLDAWQKVEAASSKAKLVIAGTGNEELLGQVRDQVSRLNLQRVTLDLRFVSPEELVDLHRRADVVVYPYRAITTSGALATGLALGKAVIASDLPAFREALQGGVDGLLVQPGSVEELADAILALTDDPEKRKQFAQQISSRNWGGEAWQRIAHKTRAVYEHLLTADAKQNA